MYDSHSGSRRCRARRCHVAAPLHGMLDVDGCFIFLSSPPLTGAVVCMLPSSILPAYCRKGRSGLMFLLKTMKTTLCFPFFFY